MVCCALITLVLAALLWPMRKLASVFRPSKISPLQWQLSTVSTPPLPPLHSPRTHQGFRSPPARKVYGMHWTG